MKKKVRIDSRGRISLGEFAERIDGFFIKKDKKGRIILEPFIEVKFKETEIANDRKLKDRRKKDK